ncbi:hypothetical protein PSH90_12160 [Pseudomonas sp. FP1762]|uniref:hypothetical protein n=1 Tax=Pseudomonas TaxID=286 RepID=UPI001F46D046|nr:MULTISPECIES: hypothetical protein [Pseudomonas]UIN53588.1 hypothetical protein LXN51_21890 [Pseudomonas kribbensis]WLG64819.1 hypothetical protein PSH90_12160 [Pseudomonas sp. FP1762]
MKPPVEQERINIALVSGLLEVWQAAATQLSLNVEITAALAALTEDEDKRKVLVTEVMKSRDSMNAALEKVKRAVRLISPESLGEEADATD